MAKKIKFDEPKEDIPAWFLTYSDVITLLMTFFILLLTFATTEPESFERVQVTFFGGGGGTGVAGKASSALSKDAIISRIRPASSRITQRGSENQPIDTDTSLETLALGLSGMEREPEHRIMQGHELRTDLNLFVDRAKITPVGEQRMQMLARQLKQGRFTVTFRVAVATDLPRAHLLMERLHAEGVPFQKTALELTPLQGTADHSLCLRLEREEK